MISISYTAMFIFITALWLLVRGYFWIKNKAIDWRREAVLLLVYICFVVVARFTFFPMATVDGRIRPLIFDKATAFPPRINFLPFVNLFDYTEKRDIILNVVGNTTMFIPLGIVWPIVYKKLNTHGRVIAAGFGVTAFIEIMQLPFYDRVSDIDDLILNSVGYITGYGIYLLANKIIAAVKANGITG